MPALNLTTLRPDVAVSPQLEPAALAEVAAAGFKSVINNRPDGEGGAAQPTSADMEAAARAAGLNYVYLPVQPAVHTPEEIARFTELLATLPRPILAFCRSGARSTKLFNATSAGG